MEYGFIKAAAITPQIRVADCDYNAGQICTELERAAERGVNLAVFPELCITGYTCGDLFLQETLLNGAQNALETIIRKSRDFNLIGAVGLPVAFENKLYNCAAVFSKGKLLGLVPKKNIPNYGEFYELRHFEPAPSYPVSVPLGDGMTPMGTNLLFFCTECPEFVLAAEICEDLWVAEPPSVRHTAAGATVIVNLSASDETIGKGHYRRQLVESQSARLICGYVYCDAGDGESTTDMIFSGHNLIAENGTLLAESQLFENGILSTDLDVSRLCGERRRTSTYKNEMRSEYTVIPFSLSAQDNILTREISPTPFIPSVDSEREDRCELILTMQSAGLRKRLSHTGAKTAVVGISGGLDSCLALLVAVRAMDALKRSRKEIIAVTMPCFGTTLRTKNNALRLSEILGVTLREIEITQSVEQHFADIGHTASIQDVTFENAQARERTQVLMDIANQTGGLVIGTGDLSELALGWATYNGDHMSMYGVNASVPKTLVRYIIQHVAVKSASLALGGILEDILKTPVSPELLPAQEGEIAQKTEDLVGPYELHDFFLYYMFRFGFSPKKIFFLAQQAFRGKYTDSAILKWEKVFYKRFFSQQFKRSCLPDGPKVGSVTLSPRSDWRMPSDACAALWIREMDQIIDNPPHIWTK